MNQNMKAKEIYHLNNNALEQKEGGINVGEIRDIIIRNFPLILGFTVTFGGLGLLKVITTPPLYISSFELLSEPLNIETQVTSTDDESRETREQINSVDLDKVQLKILKSPRLILRVVESLQDQYPTLNYQELINNLTIEIIADTNNKQNILQVIYKNSNKQKVSDVTNTISQVYLNYSIEKRQSGLKRGIAFLDQQIPRISSQVKNTENQIQELRSQYNFIKPDVSIDRINNRLDNLTQEKTEVTTKLQELEFQSQNLEQELQNRSTNSATAIAIANPQYIKLINELQAVELEIGAKSAIFSAQSLELQTLNQEKDEILALIIQEESVIRQKMNNQIEALKNRQKLIALEMQSIKNQLEQWSEISRRYSNLQQKLSSTNNKLNEFNLQKDTLLIDIAQQEKPWQILTPVSEPRISSISKFNYLLLSSTLGTLISVGAALVIDQTQKIIYTSAKIEEITNLPILAKIPYKYSKHDERKLSLINQIIPLKAKLSNNRQSSSSLAFSETGLFRSFAVNLGVFDFGSNVKNSTLRSNIKSLAITSAIPKEGKSTVAFNLAKASASMGKRVLLVDTDLRSKNSLTNNLGLELEMGLWNFLNKSDRSLGLQFIKQVPPEENLFILPSGFEDLTINSGASSDPSRLLVSKKMHLLMEELQNYYDLIIYDLCAIIGFADVNLLANKTDGIVFVTGLGKIQTITLMEALNQLVICNTSILGVAVNKLSS